MMSHPHTSYTTQMFQANSERVQNFQQRYGRYHVDFFWMWNSNNHRRAATHILNAGKQPMALFSGAVIQGGNFLININTL